MKKFSVFLCTMLLVFGASGIARASIINFDDISFAELDEWTTSGPVPWQDLTFSGYMSGVVPGLDWFGFYAIPEAYYRSNFCEKNYPNSPKFGSNTSGGSYSSPNAVTNEIGEGVESIWSTPAAFDLTGAYFSTVLFNNASSEFSASRITITGRSYDVATDTWTGGECKTIDLGTSFAWHAINLTGYHGYWFDATTVGGEPGSYLMDNLTINEAPVPEPATMLLLGAGLIGLAGLGRKKFFKKA